MKWFATAVGFVVLLFPAAAHAAVYFEFAPDYSVTLPLSSGQEVQEIFQPQNDFLGGYDFWVTNTASSAVDLSVTLVNPAGTTLSTQTVPVVPTSDPIRMTVNFPSQFPVNGAGAYRMVFVPSADGLGLSYADVLNLVPGSGAIFSPYRNGVAVVNGQEQAFSFLFALRENREYSPPVVTSVTLSQPAIGQVALSWFANEPVDAQVTLPATAVAFSNTYDVCLPATNPCTAVFSVSPGVTYAYTLTVRDVWGNATTSTGAFTALGAGQTPTPTPTPTPLSTVTPTPTGTPVPDTTKPIISNLRSVNITADGFTIAWTTNEATNMSAVAFELPYLIFGAAVADSTLELEHTAAFTGLIQDTAYRTRIRSSDAAGNVASASIDVLVARPTPTPTNPTPMPSPTPGPSLTPTPTISIGPASPAGTDLQWSPVASGQALNGYRIDIIGSDGKLIRSVRTNDTHANVGDVPPGASVVVYADKAGVYEKVAAPVSVTRRKSFLEQLVTVAPYALGALVVAIGISIAVIRFRKPKAPAAPTAAPTPPTSGAMPNPSQF